MMLINVNVPGGRPHSKCCGNCLSQLGDGKGTELYIWKVWQITMGISVMLFCKLEGKVEGRVMIFVLEFQGHFRQSQQKFNSFEQVFV